MKSVHINLPGNRGTQQLSRLQDLLQLRHISAKTLRSGYSCSQRENVKYLLYNMRRCSSSRLTFCLQTLEGFCLHTTPLVPCCCLTISLLLFGKTQATRFFSIFLLWKMWLPPSGLCFYSKHLLGEKSHFTTRRCLWSYICFFVNLRCLRAPENFAHESLEHNIAFFFFHSVRKRLQNSYF